MGSMFYNKACSKYKYEYDVEGIFEMLLAIDVTLEGLDPGSGNIANDTCELGTALGHINSEHWTNLSVNK